MGFTRMGKNTSRGPSNPNGVTMAIHRSKASIACNVYIGGELADDAGFSIGQKTELEWGTGDDAGLLRLVHTEAGPTLSSRNEDTRLLHSTCRVPDSLKAFGTTDAYIVSVDKFGIVIEIPRQVEPLPLRQGMNFPRADPGPL